MDTSKSSGEEDSVFVFEDIEELLNELISEEVKDEDVKAEQHSKDEINVEPDFSDTTSAKIEGIDDDCDVKTAHDSKDEINVEPVFNDNKTTNGETIDDASNRKPSQREFKSEQESNGNKDNVKPVSNKDEDIDSVSDRKPTCRELHFDDLKTDAKETSIKTEASLKELLDMIKSGDDLPDDVIDRVVSLMKTCDTKGAFNIQPIRPCEMETQIHVSKHDTAVSSVQDKNTITIHHIPRHWLTSYLDVNRKNIYIYDSLLADIHKAQLEPQLKEVYGNKVTKFQVVYPDVTQQTYNTCGFFAIANAFCCLKGIRPEDQKLDEDGMRAHLIKCLDENNIQLFPQKDNKIHNERPVAINKNGSPSTPKKINEDEKPFPTDARITRVELSKLQKYYDTVPETFEDTERAFDKFVDDIRGKKKSATDVILEKLSPDDKTKEKCGLKGFQIKIYHTKLAGRCPVQRFVQELVTEKERDTIVTKSATSSFIIACVRITQNKPEMFVLTTARNWHYADKIACERFPNQVANKMLKKEFTYRELINISGGPIRSVTKYARSGKCLPQEKVGPSEIVAKRTGQLNEGLRTQQGLDKQGLKFEVSRKAVKIVSSLKLSELLNVFSVFSDYFKEDEPEDERLKTITDESLKARLNRTLADKMRYTVDGNYTTGVYLELPPTVSFKRRTFRVALPDSSRKRVLKSVPPCLDEVLCILKEGGVAEDKWLEVTIEADTFTYELKNLIEFFIPLDEYIYRFHDGKWYSFTYQYWYELERDFLETLRLHFLKPSISIPLLKWVNISSTGNVGRRKVTTYKLAVNEDIVLKTDTDSIKNVEDIKGTKWVDLEDEKLISLLFLRTSRQLTEGEYNECYSILQRILNRQQQNRFTIILGDKMKIKEIELFDILIADNEKTYVVHVKDGFGQSTRDACNQLRNSAEIIHRDLLMGQVGKTLKAYFKSNKLEQKTGIPVETFLSFFGIQAKERELIFVLALRDATRKNISGDARNAENLPQTIRDAISSNSHLKVLEKDIYTQLQTEEIDVLDSNGNLTNTFLMLTKVTDIEEQLSPLKANETIEKEIIKVLLRFKSNSKSSIAKLCITELKKQIQKYFINESSFKFKLVNLADEWLQFQEDKR